MGEVRWCAWWAAISGFAVMQTSFTGSMQRTAHRILGTLIGAALGTIAGPWIGDRPWLFVPALGVIGGVTVYCGNGSRAAYAWVVGGVTALCTRLASGQDTAARHGENGTSHDRLPTGQWAGCGAAAPATRACRFVRACAGFPRVGRESRLRSAGYICRRRRLKQALRTRIRHAPSVINPGIPVFSSQYVPATAGHACLSRRRWHCTARGRQAALAVHPRRLAAGHGCRLPDACV